MVFDEIILTEHAEQRLDERGIIAPVGVELYRLTAADRRGMIANGAKMKSGLLYLRHRQDGRRVVFVFRIDRHNIPLLITAYYLTPKQVKF